MEGVGGIWLMWFAGGAFRRPDAGQYHADRDGLPLRHHDLEYDAAVRARDLGIDLVGGHLEQGIVEAVRVPTARSHRVTVPVVMVSPSFGILKTSAMAISPHAVATRRSVLMISGSCGTAASSSAGLVGIGVFFPAMRTTGPSSCQKHSSATVAAISAP